MVFCVQMILTSYHDDRLIVTYLKIICIGLTFKDATMMTMDGYLHMIDIQRCQAIGLWEESTWMVICI